MTAILTTVYGKDYNFLTAGLAVKEESMGKKRILSLLIVTVLVLSLCACKKNQVPEAAIGGPADGQSQVKAADETIIDDTNTTEGVTAQGTMVPGTLNFINLDDRDASVLRGLKLTGNRAGSGEDSGFNNKKAGTADIRCIFELNEYVGVYPDTDLSEGISVWVFNHQDDQSVYETADSLDGVQGLVFYTDLIENTDDPTWPWAEFYLNPEENGAGYYDLVFVYEGKAIATTLVYFYNIGELEDKSDAELEQLTKGIQ